MLKMTKNQNVKEFNNLIRNPVTGFPVTGFLVLKKKKSMQKIRVKVTTNQVVGFALSLHFKTLYLFIYLFWLFLF